MNRGRGVQVVAVVVQWNLRRGESSLLLLSVLTCQLTDNVHSEMIHCVLY